MNWLRDVCLGRYCWNLWSGCGEVGSIGARAKSRGVWRLFRSLIGRSGDGRAVSWLVLCVVRLCVVGRVVELNRDRRLGLSWVPVLVVGRRTLDGPFETSETLPVALRHVTSPGHRAQGTGGRGGGSVSISPIVTSVRTPGNVLGGVHTLRTFPPPR